MSMKKAFDQTIRDLKREVNKKVLKVPSIEQKVLDATSNESWGPHGSLLADIAQATRNYHEYQMIMSVLWRRLNDTGKNWRHVYKGLTVLEYLVAHGSERVIDEIRERAYQISTLSDFQYIDSGGRDQGNNVRRKSQILVQLVNDKERIQEVRQKAASNREKFHSTSAVGGMYRPGSGGYGDDRYEGHDERNGYGREREWGSRDDERYGRYGDSYSREGDRYGRDSEDQYGRDRYSDDDYRGRAQSVDDFQYGTRSRSSDRGDRAYDDDDRHSARESSVKGEDHADGRPIERKYSEQNIGAPPSYEDAVGVSKSPTYSDRDGEPPAVSAPQSSPPTVNAAPQSSFPLAKTSPQSSSPINSVNPSQVTSENGVSSHPNIEADAVDEFDPRGAVPATPSISNSAEMDLFGSLSDVFSPSPLALMPTPSGISDFQPDSRNSASNLSFTTASGSNDFNQFFEDPFGDSPFKALPSDEAPAQPRNFASQSPYHLPVMNPSEHLQPASQKMETPNLEFARTFSGITFNPTTASDVQTPPNQQFLPHEQHSMQDNDILAGILPTGPLPPTASNGPYPTSSGMHPAAASQASFPTPPHTSAGLDYMTKAGPSAAPFSQVSSQNMAVLSGYHNSIPYSALSTTSSNLAPQAPTEASSHQNNNFMGDFLPQSGATISQSSQLAPSGSSGPLALVPQQPAKEKFEPKSTVWADTLSKGLVNLNISGPKINPLSDIGIDFESLNRKEKRMEKPSATPATSNVTMGKAMGSGSGMGRAGAGVLSPSPNAIMNPGMGLGMGMGGGLGMGSYGAMNQLPRGIGEGMGMGMGMRMNMGMGQGVTMQQPNGFAPGPNTNNYNPMMGSGGYPQPYGGAYR